MPRLTSVFEDRFNDHAQDADPTAANSTSAHGIGRLATSGTLISFALVCLVIAGLIASWLNSSGRLDLLSLGLQKAAHQTTAVLGLRVTQIEFIGQKRSDLSNVHALVDQQPLLSVDAQSLKSHIEMQPWIKTSQVRRAFPNMLEIRVIEQAPAAVLQVNHRLALIDRYGAIIKDAPVAKFTNLPLIVGDVQSSEIDALLSALTKEDRLMSQLKSAVFIGQRRWDLQLGEHLRVKLPSADLDQAIAELAKLERQTDLVTKDVRLVDLRIPGRLILRLGEANASKVVLNSDGVAA